ncbi:MAG: hypothetical protein DSZ08_03795 [Sulfurovum sp.]|nr:MAG: hypothetical protein DSZ08_03795 [Sulfurovum sp.]
MLNFVLTIVFSIVMLIFMIYPAMKIVEYLESKLVISTKWHQTLVIVTTIVLSLLIGLFLQFG